MRSLSVKPFSGAFLGSLSGEPFLGAFLGNLSGEPFWGAFLGSLFEYPFWGSFLRTLLMAVLTEAISLQSCFFSALVRDSSLNPSSSSISGWGTNIPNGTIFSSVSLLASEYILNIKMRRRKAEVEAILN